MLLLKYATRFRQTTNENNVSKYEQTFNTEYRAGSDGETIIILNSLIGTRVVQIEREIKPIYASDYSFNTFTGQITLLNSVQMGINETLFIIYAKIIIE
jgi:hypothetical protein